MARRKDRLDAITASLNQNGQNEIRAVSSVGDVTRDGDVERAVALAIEKFGRLDIVFANAGFSVSGPLESLTLDDYRRQFETNVFGVLRTVFAALPELRKAHGRLVLIGSVAGHVTLPEMSAYSMSKFSIRALAESIRGELKPEKVSVTLISPGFVESEIRKVGNRGVLVQEAKDPVPPWLVVSTKNAVSEILQAVHKRSSETVVTGHGKVIVWVHRLFPSLFRKLGASLAGIRRREERASK